MTDLNFMVASHSEQLKIKGQWNIITQKAAIKLPTKE